MQKPDRPAGSGEQGGADGPSIAVWDLPLRLFHWALALSVVVGIAAIKLDNIDLHVRCGQITLALLLFRLAWGFVGPEHARFASFVRGPHAIASYARSMLRPPHEFHAGHNPLGGIVVMLMIGLLLLQAVTGLFANDDIATDGPLVRFISKSTSDAMTALHHRNGGLIIGLIALHIFAIFAYLIRFRDNLIHPMVTGMKAVPSGEHATGITGSRTGLAIVLIALCALAVWLAFRLPRWIAPMPF